MCFGFEADVPSLSLPQSPRTCTKLKTQAILVYTSYVLLCCAFPWFSSIIVPNVALPTILQVQVHIIKWSGDLSTTGFQSSRVTRFCQRGPGSTDFNASADANEHENERKACVKNQPQHSHNIYKYLFFASNRLFFIPSDNKEKTRSTLKQGKEKQSRTFD
jgi:hypothetical protein